jgi:hypothetical protein
VKNLMNASLDVKVAGHGFKRNHLTTETVKGNAMNKNNLK